MQGSTDLDIQTRKSKARILNISFEFLKTLKLRSILYICEDDYSDENLEFLKEQNIKIFHYKIQGNKEPFIEIDHAELAEALANVMDTLNHPSNLIN